ncbi:hypothetical protein HMI54_005886 [Coelomomyces lativittatus]|nr:hypothetical protein HMI56_004570 [Coelomomyces lativittatus]KAJ1515439.1 hypothetical protein HMI55_003701 [Coelomomyces lativittatus]KAJ1517357.1 hypothetical protein HMI54_005886 [Coelomomyces lativittatus]
MHLILSFSLLAFLLSPFTTALVLPPASNAADKGASHPSTVSTDRLSLNANTISKHTTATHVDTSKMSMEDMKSTNLNLADLEKHFGLIKQGKTKTLPGYWEKANDFATQGPVQVLNQLDSDDFSVVIYSTDDTDINGLLNLFNTIFKDEDAKRVGKETNKFDSLISSCINMLGASIREQQNEAIAIPVIDLMTTMSSDLELLSLFSEKNGDDKIHQLAASDNPNVRKKAQQFQSSLITNIVLD